MREWLSAGRQGDEMSNADQQQGQRRNNGGCKSPALLKAQGAAECAGGIIDSAGISVQQALRLQNMTDALKRQGMRRSSITCSAQSLTRERSI
jgi:hypothetical protein